MNAALPSPYRVVARRVETHDTATLTLEPAGEALSTFDPGQFAMLTAYGIGEVPISLSGQEAGVDGGPRRLVHTLRAVGAVTRALHRAQPGDVIGVRGPFGNGWDVSSAAGRDIVVVAGGIGFAPLRPVVLGALADRARYGRLVVLVGARTPADLLYVEELDGWAKGDGVSVAVTVDRPDGTWTGHVGVVTTLLADAGFEPRNSVAFVCGPEVMMRFAAEALIAHGMPAARIRLSLERNMRCGVGWCGHCQYGPLLLCRDGPVTGYSRARPLMRVREL
jgi:anaerobic sulfite reductase subunit B